MTINSEATNSIPRCGIATPPHQSSQRLPAMAHRGAPALAFGHALASVEKRSIVLRRIISTGSSKFAALMQEGPDGSFSRWPLANSAVAHTQSRHDYSASQPTSPPSLARLRHRISIGNPHSADPSVIVEVEH
jgi:hypothetical protein